METYLGFYPSGDYWVGNSVDIWSYCQQGEMIDRGFEGGLGKQFEKEMSEEVFIYDEPEYILKICRDGLILFSHKDLRQLPEGSITDEDRWWGLAYKYLNCMNVVFHSALCKAEVRDLYSHAWMLTEITNKDVTYFCFQDGKCLTRPNMSKTHHEKFCRRSLGSDFGPNGLHRLLFLRFVPALPQQIFDTLNEDFRDLSADDSTLRDVSILAQSLGQYKMANFDISVILAWTLIEQHIGKLWEWFVGASNLTYANGNRRIDKERRKSLENTRDYSASIRSNILEFLNVIPFEEFNRINKLRKCRNDFIHSREPCRIEDAGLGIRNCS